MRPFKLVLLLILTILSGQAAATECNLESDEFAQSASPETLIVCFDTLEGQPTRNELENIVRYGHPSLVKVAFASLSKQRLNEIREKADRHLRTLMHVAVDNPNPGVLPALGLSKIDLNARFNFDDGGWMGESRGTTPLHLASMQGKADHVAVLLALGAKVSPKNKRNKKPAELAKDRGVDLVFYAYNGSGSEETIALITSRSQPKPIAGKISCNQFLTNEFFQTAKPENVAYCLQNGASVSGDNKEGSTALHLAAKWGKDPALILALISGASGEGLKNLLARKNLKGKTPLHQAVEFSANPEVLTLLIALGAPVNAKDSNGKTPLHLAAKRGDELADRFTARLLAGNTAKGILNAAKRILFVTEIPDNNGNTPLHLAASYDNVGLATSILLIHGFNPDEPNNLGMTPLMYAAVPKTDQTRQGRKFSDKDEWRLFTTMLGFSKKPCDQIKEKFGKLAGRTVLDFAKKNSALTKSDTSGQKQSTVSSLLNRCSQ